MKLSQCLLVLPIFLMALTATSAAKSMTEVSRKPTSGKYITKLMSMKKQKSKSKGQRKTNARLPKMGFLPGNSYHSSVEDQMQASAPRQEIASYIGVPRVPRQELAGLVGIASAPRQDISGLIGVTSAPRQDFASLLGVSANHRQEMVGLLNGASRLSAVENSPVYYVRLPPTPYMYTPGLGYISQQTSQMANAALRNENYQGNSVHPFMNLPVNFMSNGQPNGAYDFSMPELMSSTFPGKGFLRQEPPIFGRRQFFDDSRLSALKGRYDFNGRPEGLYVLPESAYYQSNMFK